MRRPGLGRRAFAISIARRSTGPTPRLEQALSDKRRRDSYFLTHKLSNAEQSTRPRQVKRAVQRACADLKTPYLDLCLIHSPLTDPPRRLATYRALTELQRDGLVRSVGVCHYGVSALQEIVQNNLPAPAVIQLQLSPFNQHQDVAAWAATAQQRAVLRRLVQTEQSRRSHGAVASGGRLGETKAGNQGADLGALGVATGIRLRAPVGGHFQSGAAGHLGKFLGGVSPVAIERRGNEPVKQSGRAVARGTVGGDGRVHGRGHCIARVGSHPYMNRLRWLLEYNDVQPRCSHLQVCSIGKNGNLREVASVIRRERIRTC